MTKRDIIKLVVIITGMIAAVALVITILLVFKRREETVTKELIQSMDREVKAIQQQRDIYREWLKDKDEEIRQHEVRDSLLSIKQTQTIIKYEKVPITVRNYSHDELRGAIEDFQ